MNASACAVLLHSHSVKHHLECFYSINFEPKTTSQIALGFICCNCLSIWTVISLREIRMTALIVITVFIDTNIMSTTYSQQLVYIVIIICVCCLVNLEYLLVIELYDECIFIFNIFLILWWLLLLLEISSKRSIMFWVNHIQDIVFKIHFLMETSSSKCVFLCTVNSFDFELTPTKTHILNEILVLLRVYKLAVYLMH